MPRSVYAVVIAALFPSFGFAQAPQFTISTIAGNGTAAVSGDGGSAVNAALNNPYGAAVDSSGNLYIGDSGNHRVRKVTPGGTIITAAGTGASGFAGDGGPATQALLNDPLRLVFDTTGNLYIADDRGNRIRRLSPNGTISTVAGNGISGYSGDGVPAISASLNTPVDVAADAAGNLYIADQINDVIRKVDTNGIITTVVGNGNPGFSGDGGDPTKATLNAPTGLAWNGALFFADRNNLRVRKVLNGIITTIAGGGNSPLDGVPATSARLNNPTGICLDSSGILYIADTSNNRVRAVLPNGMIFTIAGNGTAGYSGDGGVGTSAALNDPRGVTASAGRIYIADSQNNRIRVLTPVSHPPVISSGLSASAFGGFTSVSPGSWIEIYGSNLATDTRSWAGADFNGVNAPTSLDGTTVTIGGKPAFIDYISPGQVNALVSSDTPVGAHQLVVTTAVGASAPFNITVNAAQPGLLAPSAFAVGGKQYAVALFPDGTYVLPVGAIAGVSSRPAKTGDTIILYGVGFGPVTPNLPAGQLVQQANSLASSLQVSVGGMPAMASYAGLAPNYTGLYQFNLVVPSTGNGALTFSLGGAAATQTLNIAVGN